MSEFKGVLAHLEKTTKHLASAYFPGAAGDLLDMDIGFRHCKLLVIVTDSK
jgi:hypothetical protein